MSDYVEQLGGINVPLVDICKLVDCDISINPSFSSFVTSFSIKSDIVCIETDIALDSNEIILGRKAAAELAELWRQIQLGECDMSKIKETTQFKQIRQ